MTDPDDPIDRVARELAERVTLSPRLVSQLTCLATLGVSPRHFTRLLAAYGRDHRVVRVGHLRVVDAAELAAWILDRAARRPATTGDDEVDRVLRRVGR